MSPRVRAVRAGTATLPLPAPLRLGPMVTGARIRGGRVETEDGLVGTAYCLTRNAPVAACVERLVAPVVTGREADPATLWEACTRATVTIGRTGLVVRAIGLVDVALWDIAARAAGLPLWRHLEARLRSRRGCSSPPTRSRTHPESLAEDVIRYARGRLDAPEARPRRRPRPHAPVARGGCRRAPRRRAARRRRGLRLALERGGAHRASGSGARRRSPGSRIRSSPRTPRAARRSAVGGRIPSASATRSRTSRPSAPSSMPARSTSCGSTSPLSAASPPPGACWRSRTSGGYPFRSTSTPRSARTSRRDRRHDRRDLRPGLPGGNPSTPPTCSAPVVRRFVTGPRSHPRHRARLRARPRRFGW